MNSIIIIGIFILLVDIIWAVYSQLIKKWSWKKMIIFLLIAFMGVGIAEYGDNIRKMSFTKENLAFIQENKNFSSFTDKDVELYYKSLITFRRTKPEIYEKYYNQFLEWGIDKYLDDNKERKLSREEVKIIIEKKMKNQRKSK